MVALLLCSAAVTSIKGGALARAVSLQESPQLRGVMGSGSIGRMATSFLRWGNQVERSGMPPPSGGHADTFWNIDGTRAWVLGEPAPARGRATLGYRIYIPDSSVLTWGIALDPKVWSPDKGDGVIFRVLVRDAAQTVSMFGVYLDPKNVPADRHIFRYALPLFGYAGETVVVELVTESGPRGDANFDAAGWLNPRLTRVPVNTNFEAPPYKPLPWTVVATPLVHSQNYVASIANWQTDQSNTDRLAAWNRSLTSWSVSPLWGLGPGSVDEAAIRSGGGQAIVTESEIAKVLVETGLVGVALWIALWTRGLWTAWAACRRDPEQLWILAGLVCIGVSSIAFQVLEVKQIAALFWVLLGAAMSVEVSRSAVAPAAVGVPAASLVADRLARWRNVFRREPGRGPVADALPLGTSAVAASPAPLSDFAEADDVQQASSGPEIKFPSSAYDPARAILRDQKVTYNASMVEAPASFRDSAPLSSGSQRHSAVHSDTHDLSTIRLVKLAPTEADANENLRHGWELLSIQDAGSGGQFVLGLRDSQDTLSAPEAEDEDSSDA
jgi:hypothetical protein